MKKRGERMSEARSSVSSIEVLSMGDKRLFILLCLTIVINLSFEFLWQLCWIVLKLLLFFGLEFLKDSFEFTFKYSHNPYLIILSEVPYS